MERRKGCDGEGTWVEEVVKEVRAVLIESRGSAAGRRRVRNTTHTG